MSDSLSRFNNRTLLGLVSNACLGVALVTGFFMPSTQAKETLDVARTLKESNKFAYLADTLKHTKRLKTLLGPEQFTLFVPENKVFSKMSYGKWSVLWNDPKKLDRMISNGIVKGNYDSSKFSGGAKLKNINGGTLNIECQGKKYWIGKVKVKETDIVCSNGVIHLLDDFIDEPPAAAPVTSTKTEKTDKPVNSAKPADSSKPADSPKPAKP